MKLGPALVLSSTVTLPYISAVPTFQPFRGTKPFDSGDLQTPNHEAFLLHEIRFAAANGASNIPTHFGPPNLSSEVGPFLRLAMRVGNYDIIPEQLPLWALAASRDFSLEGAAWRFPLAKPLFIPSGMAIFASASRPATALGAFTLCEPEGMAGYDIDLSITLVGRTVVGDFPRTMTVPLVSAYAPTGAVASGTGFLSVEGTLHNPLQRSIDLRYGLGRVCGLWSAASPPTSGKCRAWEVADVRMSMPCQLSHGNLDIITPRSEFNVAFDPCTRVLNLAGLTLPGGERLVFKADAPTYTPQAMTAFMPVVSIIGDRKEVVP